MILEIISNCPARGLIRMETSVPPREKILDHLERVVGRRFANPGLGLQALTHSSAKEKDLPCNERLEFLGDAILGQVVSELLYSKFPDYEEGELSTMKSIIVSAKTLSAHAQDLELDKVIILGRGLREKKSLPRSILCNALEALIAALYLDAGFDAARQFVLKLVSTKLDEILLDRHEKNYKSLLQDYAQRRLAAIPTYRVLKEVGPDHKKLFQVVVELDGRVHGPSWGANKKEAEQKAARRALATLGLITPGENGKEEEEPAEGPPA
ncbi:MAG: ribonuclease III [Planctomycetes bacterium]|nr:ribonuclease III [Planctomycetota bacterium]